MAGLESADYINMHGIITPIKDANETKVIKKVFGDKVPPVSFIKRNTGHCLGTTGAIEAVVLIMALDKKSSRQ